jgi:hypothetical protein
VVAVLAAEWAAAAADLAAEAGAEAFAVFKQQETQLVFHFFGLVCLRRSARLHRPLIAQPTHFNKGP